MFFSNVAVSIYCYCIFFRSYFVLVTNKLSESLLCPLVLELCHHPNFLFASNVGTPADGGENLAPNFDDLSHSVQMENGVIFEL